MALIYDASTEWSDPITLSKDEIWQTRHGNIFITTTENPDPEDGLSLVQSDGLRLRAGMNVRYRKTSVTPALIVRESI